MLSDAKIRAAKPRAKAYKLTDSHRLYLQVMPSGSRLWKWGFSYGGKQKVMPLGDYPRVSLLEARTRRDRFKGEVEEGIDPSLAKKLRAEGQLEAARQTFERIAREWHENTKGRWTKVHAKDVLQSLERDVFPKLGDLPISQISAPKVLEALKAIENRGAIETAKRVRQRISAVFVHAMATGLVDKDPAEKLGAVLKPLFKGRQPAITDLALLRKMIDDAEGDYARPITRLALRMLALTAVRPNEIRGAQWYEFENLNGKAPLWRIPALRMKGGHERKAEVGGDHLVPLAPQCVEVLRALWPLTGKGDLLFPNNRYQQSREKIQSNKNSPTEDLKDALENCPSEVTDIFQTGSLLAHAASRVGAGDWAGVMRARVGDVYMRWNADDKVPVFSAIPACPHQDTDSPDDFLSGKVQTRALNVPPTSADCSADGGKGALELARTRMQSIADKIRGRTALSDDEKQFVGNVKTLPVYRLLEWGVRQGVPDSVIGDTDDLVALSLAYQMLNDLTRSIDFAVTNAERGATVAGASSADSSRVCQTKILSKGIEQLRDLREEVLRQRAQMRQSYLAALNQANLSANYAGLLRQRDRDARDAAGTASYRNR